MMPSNLAIVILAAGASSRLGHSKQLLEIAGNSLIYRVAKIACALAEAFDLEQPRIITGKDADEVEQQLVDFAVSCHFNTHWQQGMGTSISFAVSELTITEHTPTELTLTDLTPREKAKSETSNSKPMPSHILLMTCDQVLLTFESLSRLIEKSQANPSAIIVAHYGGTSGIPTIFPQELFEQLRSLKPQQGAKKLIQEYSEQTIAVDIPEAIQDLDTLKDEIAVKALFEKLE